MRVLLWAAASPEWELESSAAFWSTLGTVGSGQQTCDGAGH